MIETTKCPSQPRTPLEANAAGNTRRLSELPTGAHGVVRQVAGAGPALQRLMAMGLCPGREVAVLRQGNPLIVRILGARVGISVRVARQIIVESGMA